MAAYNSIRQRALLLLFALIFYGNLISNVNSLRTCLPNYTRLFKNININNIKKIDTALYAEMRILIHGTKNAYTTMRSYDLILYELYDKPEGKERGLGVFTPDNEILPLCTHEKGSNEFYVDPSLLPYSADTLKKENRLLRIVSADRRGTDCFVVEEYLDTDILIPVNDPSRSLSALHLVGIETTESKDPSITASTPIVRATTKIIQDGNDKYVAPMRNNKNNVDTINMKLQAAIYESQLVQLQILQLNADREVKLLQLELQQFKQNQVVSNVVSNDAIEEYVKKSTETEGDLDLMMQSIDTNKRAIKANQLNRNDTNQIIQTQHTVGVSSPNAPKAVGSYSQAVIANGFVFVSGCIGYDKNADSGIAGETRQAILNLKSIILEAGSDLSKVCKVTIMIREIGYMVEVNRIYSEFFNLEDMDVLPARSTFEVSSLPLGAFIEIDATCLL